jgi:hypothetical protein
MGQFREVILFLIITQMMEVYIYKVYLIRETSHLFTHKNILNLCKEFKKVRRKHSFLHIHI